jgi:hypothetical protein
VKPNTIRRSSTLLASATCIFFFLAGQAFLSRLGVQNDEALFGYAFLEPRTGFMLHVGHSRLPLMLMGYLGTLKAWIYRPIFMLFGTGVWALREPMLLAGAVSIWLFYLLLRRASGERAALVGCGLLAADAIYLLTACFDWGPVALQHLLLIGGLLQLLRFYQERRLGSLFWGFLLFGLAMWDKALSVWMLAGIGVAGLALFPRQIWRVTAWRTALIATVAFGLGALPLIVFNAKTHLETFRGQQYSLDDVSGKARLLMNTARGSALLGWMVNEDWQTAQPHPPATALEKASRALSGFAGRPRENLLLYAFLLGLLLAPLARGSDLRAILFALIAMAVQWAQMAVVVNAGGSVHHAVLLWPLPHMVTAVSFAAASRRLGRAARPVLACAMAAMVISGGLLMNEYYRMAWQNGGAQNWTDAVFPLSRYMKDAPAERVYCVDWGILDSLRLLNRGKLPLSLIYDAIPRDQGEPDEDRIREAAANPENVFIAHAQGFEYMEGINAKLVRTAEDLGYRRATITVIADSYGRPTYEVYRFQPQAAAAVPAHASR